MTIQMISSNRTERENTELDKCRDEIIASPPEQWTITIDKEEPLYRLSTRVNTAAFGEIEVNLTIRFDLFIGRLPNLGFIETNTKSIILEHDEVDALVDSIQEAHPEYLEGTKRTAEAFLADLPTSGLVTDPARAGEWFYDQSKNKFKLDNGYVSVSIMGEPAKGPLVFLDSGFYCVHVGASKGFPGIGAQMEGRVVKRMFESLTKNHPDTQTS